MTVENKDHAAAAAFAAAMRERNADIRAISEPHCGDPEIRAYVDNVIDNADPAVTAAVVGQHILKLLARNAEPLNGGAFVAAGSFGGLDKRSSDFVNAASDSLAMRAGIAVPTPHAAVRDMQGMGLGDIVRACVSRAGRGFGSNQSHAALIKAAMSSSDFPLILESTLGKAMRSGAAAEPKTYEAWTRRVLVPDFKAQSRVILGSAPDLLPVAEGAEYKLGSMDEYKSVPYSVTKFGRLIRLTWEALVNDDLGAFTRIAQALGQAAVRAEADSVYASFAQNAGAGPEMQDGVELFHATHKNIASSTATLTAGALSAARVLLRRQTAVGGGVLNLTPRYLLVAPEHEQAAETLLAAAARNLSQGAENALVPAWLAQLELVVEARLDDGVVYLLTAPDSIDTLERAHLDEDNGPVLSEEEGFTVDSRTYKVRHVFGNRWLDWRGAVKIPITG